MMRTIDRIGVTPAGLPLLADDIVEFHAARLLLLMHICGVSGKIEGLTKMAKLDFFVRYPEFFEVARNAVSQKEQSAASNLGSQKQVESAMVRHHYGPWDKRYYHTLAHLEAKQLIYVGKEKKSYQISLTPLGLEKARMLATKPSFMAIVNRMREVKKVFGGKTGTSLKDLIYRIFDKEVGKRPMGQRIGR